MSKTAQLQVPAQGTDDTAEHVLDAALALFLEFGFRRTTMEDVARRIGVSRVTVYRYHPDKTALLQAVIVREVMRASLEIERGLAALSIEQNPVVEGFTLTVRLARRHPLVQRLLTTEPEWSVVHMTLKAAPMMTWASASALAFLRQERFEGWLDSRNLDLAAEVLVRLLQSAVISPGGLLTSDDDDDLRRVASYVIEPLLKKPAPRGGKPGGTSPGRTRRGRGSRGAR